MSKNKELASALFGKAVSILRSYGAKKIAVFGSYARGEQRKGSDLDLLVEFKQDKSLLEFARIERELSEQLGIKANLLTERAISPYIVKRVKDEARVLY